MSNLRDQIRAYVSQVESIEAEIAELNADKSEIYKSAKDADLDVAVLRRVVAYRRKRDKGQPVEETEERFAEYLSLVEGDGLARARAREEIPPHDEDGVLIEDSLAEIFANAEPADFEPADEPEIPEHLRRGQ